MKWIELRAKSEAYRNVFIGVFGVTVRLPNLNATGRSNTNYEVLVISTVDGEKVEKSQMVKGWDLPRHLWNMIETERDFQTEI